MRLISLSVFCVILAAGQLARAAINPSPTTLRLSNASTGVEVDANVVLTNAGTTAVTINGASITQGAGSFALVSPPAFPLLLQANATVTLTVSFVAMQTGLTDGTLTVTSDAGDTDVPLVGGAGDPQVAVSPANVIFSPTPVMSTSTAQTITIKNDGFSDLQVQVTLPFDDGGTPDFSLDLTGLGGGPPYVVGFGQSATFKVSFTPHSLGAKMTVAEVSTNANVATPTVTLSGMALPPIEDMAMPPVDDMAAEDMAVPPIDDMAVPALDDMAAPLDLSIGPVDRDLAIPGGSGSMLPPSRENGCSCQLGGATPLPLAPILLFAFAALARAIVRRRR